jgi:hypothetical protein
MVHKKRNEGHHLFIDMISGRRYYYDVSDATGYKKRISLKDAKRKYGAW